jgi:acetyl esterase/lipase
MRRLVLALILFAIARPALAADEAKVIPDVVYGHKDGMALTFDVIRPAKQNGAAVIWVQSGGWYSNWTDPKVWLNTGKPFLDKGYTLFVVRHGSAPKYTVPECTADMRRSVRFIRLKAKNWDVDPDRLGVIGGSAGGHLSLMLGTTQDDGDPKSKDAVLGSGCKVAAVVALFPPTDLRKIVTDPPDIIKRNAGLKPPLSFDPKLAPGVSPLLHVNEKTAPTLLIHGDKDELVPLEHSKNIVVEFEKFKVPHKLVVIEGAAHGFTPKQNKDTVQPELMAWFDKYLAEIVVK